MKASGDHKAEESVLSSPGVTKGKIHGPPPSEIGSYKSSS